jgi:hypothetical protein
MKNLLPIGSVVLLKNAEKRLMICGWLPETDDGKNYDYMGCFYPEGFVNMEHIFLFDQEDINKVDFVGFADSEFQLFINRVSTELENRNNTMEL